MSQQTRDPNSTGNPNAGATAGLNAGLNGAPSASVPETNPDELQSMWGAVAALLDDVTVPPARGHTPSRAQGVAAHQASNTAPVERAAPPAQPPLPAPPAPSVPESAAPSPAPELPAQAAADAGPTPGAAAPEPSTPQPLPLPPWEQPPAAATTAGTAATAATAAGVARAAADDSAGAAASPTADSPVSPAPPATAAPAVPSVPPAGSEPPSAAVTAAATAAAAPAEDMDFSAVSIRGRGDGLTVAIGEGKWDELIAMLAQRLEHSGGFFRGAHVAVELGDRTLNEQELKTLSDLLISHEIVPGVVRTTSDRTFHSAIALGLAIVHESAEGSTLAAAQVASGNAEHHTYYVYRGSLRSGQVLDRSDHVVVVGDVNPGAQVISDGDILVWGRLRGMAHAGANGKTDSVIAALDLDPIQLRIATVIAATPGGATENRPRWYGGRSSSRRPEIARLVDQQLVIEAWDEAKVHGANILKRRRD